MKYYLLIFLLLSSIASGSLELRSKEIMQVTKFSGDERNNYENIEILNPEDPNTLICFEEKVKKKDFIDVYYLDTQAKLKSDKLYKKDDKFCFSTVEKYIKIGKNSLEFEYKNLTQWYHQIDGVNVTITLYVNVSDDYYPVAEKLIINNDPLSIKAEVENVPAGLQPYMYVFNGSKIFSREEWYRISIEGTTQKALYDMDMCIPSNANCSIVLDGNLLKVKFFSNSSIDPQIREINLLSGTHSNTTYDLDFEYITTTGVDYNISDYRSYWRFEDDSTGYWIDKAGIDNFQKQSSFEDSSQCINEKPCFKYPSGGSKPSAQIEAVQNITMGIHLVFNNSASTTSWDNIAGKGGDSFGIRFDGGKNVACAIKQSTGTTWLDVDVISFADLKDYLDYHIICSLNETHLCGKLNGKSENCIPVDGDVVQTTQWWQIGDTSNSVDIWTSQMVLYYRYLSSQEKKSLLSCLYKRGDVRKGCDATVGIYQTENMSVSSSDTRLNISFDFDENIDGSVLSALPDDFIPSISISLDDGHQTIRYTLFENENVTGIYSITSNETHSSYLSNITMESWVYSDDEEEPSESVLNCSCTGESDCRIPCNCTFDTMLNMTDHYLFIEGEGNITINAPFYIKTGKFSFDKRCEIRFSENNLRVIK